MHITNFKFIDFIKKSTPSETSPYIAVGVFCMIMVYSNMHTIPREALLKYPKLIEFLTFSNLFGATMLLSHPLWLESWREKNLIAIPIWNIAVFGILICSSLAFVIMSNFASMQVLIFMVNLIIIVGVSRWQWALFLIFSGIVLTFILFKNYVDSNVLIALDISVQFKIIYLLLLVSSLVVGIFRPKQNLYNLTKQKVTTLEAEVTHLDYEVSNLNEQVTHYSERSLDQQREIERLGATSQKILNNVNHELRLPIGNVINFSDMLQEALQKSGDNYIQELSKEVYKNSNRISSMILNMFDLATLDVKKVNLEKKIINFSELVEDRVKICRKIYLQDKKIDFKLTIAPEIMIAVDPNYIRQTIDNLVINAISFSETGIIKVTVSKQTKFATFIITDQGKGTPPLELSDIFTPFKMGSNTESKAEGRGIGLALCKSAIEAHGGVIKADSTGKKGASFTIILPL
ncbi:MAG: ATP-binding protein [Rickettsiaceae bacterium]